MPTRVVPFDALIIDDSVNARAKGTDPAVVAEYAAERKAGKDFPPGRAFRGPEGVILSRGFHRAKAYKEAGEVGFEVEILDGDRTAARIDAANDNATHGLKRSNDDKRNAVERCLDLCPDWTQEKVAEWCAVSQHFVGDICAERAAADAQTGDSQTEEFRFDLNSPSPRQSKRGRKGEGRKPKKETDAMRVGAALKANAQRTDDEIATGTKTKPAFVAKIRKSLEKKGLIQPRAKPPSPPKVKPGPLPALKDGLGNAVPPGLADTFGDPMLADAVARIDAAHKELLSVEQHVVNTLARKGEFWPYAQFGECAKSLKDAAARLAEASAQLANGIPFCVCPKCKGEGCKDCRNSGAWSRHRHEARAQYGDRP